MGYEWLTMQKPKVDWRQYVWNNVGPLKYQFHSWMFAQNILKTLDRLQRFNITMNEDCYLCGQEKETHEHLFFKCIYSQKWLDILNKWLQSNIPDREYIGWWTGKRFKKLRQKKYMAFVIAGLIYHIWNMRNEAWQN